MDFVHLNVHSHYSRGWGIGSISELCRMAGNLGMKKLALTDTNGLYGILSFIQAARETGIEPIIGSEIADGERRAILIAKTPCGYSRLSHIISERHCRKDFDLILCLKENREGLVVVSDDFRLLDSLKKDGMDDLFVEMSPGYGMAACYAYSRKTEIPPLATNRVFLVHKNQFQLHRILRAVSLNTRLSRLTDKDMCRENNFICSSMDMIHQFPHAPAAIENTSKTAESCFTGWEFNRLVFPNFNRMSDDEAFDKLYRLTLEGCRQRYGNTDKTVKNRIDMEMSIIRKKNFAHYFLVVEQIARKTGLSCGRGSAAASIVSYALNLTHVDPIKHNLFFERFLNPDRPDPPDIDIDFAWDEREDVIDNAFAIYGHARTAMVANHNTFGARSSIREIAKVFGLTDSEISFVTNNTGYGTRLRDIKDIQDQPRIKGIVLKKPWDEILNAAVEMEGKFNHLSTHCGGLVIVPDNIRKYCPVEISASGVQVLQWEKDSVEDAGLVKIDILGNRSLAVIRDTLEMIYKNYRYRINYSELNPIDDEKAINMFFTGDTFGVFYFESPATRQVLRKITSGFTFEKYMNTDHFHRNVVVTSIIRPASNRSIRTWISRLHGEKWDSPHTLLKPVLDETLGVMVFQEQLSLAAVHLAGFTPAEAETLRKVVTKKHRGKKLMDFHARFEKGAHDRGVDHETVKKVWEMMMGFDGYSFCKPHSASYTMVAYKSAFLKACYPAEFMASVISNQGGYYSTFGYISEARRMGITILLPDINRSEINYIGKHNEIRMGFIQLKSLSGEAKEAIVHERKKNGLFISLKDFLARTRSRVHLQDIQILIRTGCMDSIKGGKKRQDLMWEALEFMSGKKEHAQSQTSLFKDSPEKPRNLSAQDMHSHESNLKHELEHFGFIFSVHPLDLLKNGIPYGSGIIKARDLQRHVGKNVTTLGVQITGKTVNTISGELMKFVSFEDTTAIYETVFFPETYRRFCNILNTDRPYVIKGRVEEEFGAISITVNGIGFA